MTERAMMTAQDGRLQQTGGQSVPRLTSITIIIIIRITTIIIQPTLRH